MTNEADQHHLAQRVATLCAKNNLTVADNATLLQKMSERVPFPTFASDEGLLSNLKEVAAAHSELFTRPAAQTEGESFNQWLGPRRAELIKTMRPQVRMQLFREFQEATKSAGKATSQELQIRHLEAQSHLTYAQRALLSDLKGENSRKRAGSFNGRAS
jgi:hypothetical protein